MSWMSFPFFFPFCKIFKTAVSNGETFTTVTKNQKYYSRWVCWNCNFDVWMFWNRSKSRHQLFKIIFFFCSGPWTLQRDVTQLSYPIPLITNNHPSLHETNSRQRTLNNQLNDVETNNKLVGNSDYYTSEICYLIVCIKVKLQARPACKMQMF
jgi:hypothetical protein